VKKSPKIHQSNFKEILSLHKILGYIKGLENIIITVLDLVSQVRDVVLMNVYLDLGDPGGRDFGMRGIWARGEKWKDQFTSNLGTRRTDPITARRVPSK
jgi:hypothetical protein